MAPVTRGKETFVVENTQKNTHVLLLRVDKETLKGIKLFYISYICMDTLKCSTLFIYTALGLWIQLRGRGIESVRVHQRYVQSEASSHSINVTQVLEFVLTQLIALAVKSNNALSQISCCTQCKCYQVSQHKITNDLSIWLGCITGNKDTAFLRQFRLV